MAEHDRCNWCAVDPSAYYDDDQGRICRPCYAYRSKYRRMPPMSVIERRLDRRMTRVGLPA